MATSYNGWTVSADPNAININRQFGVAGTKPFKDGGFAGGIKRGAVETIFTYLVSRLHNEVEPMENRDNTGLGYGCWGYYYKRNTNNPSVWSNHASGTAIDYNAHKHVNGTSITKGNSGWSNSQAVKIADILKALGGSVRWLANGDPMHFEINTTPAGAELVAATINQPNKPPVKDDDMPVFDVVRTPDGIDYLLSDNKIVMVETPTAYDFYHKVLGLIDVPHGQARIVPKDVLSWYADKIRAWGGVADVPKVL